MTKKTFFITILGILLASCSINTLDEQPSSEGKSNRKSKYYYTLDSNIKSSNLDNDFISKYESIRKLVLKEDYKNAHILSRKLPEDIIGIHVSDTVFKILWETRKIEQNPENYAAFNDRGKYRYEFDDIKGALKEINKALEINPYYSTAYLNKAQIERDNKEYEKAKKDYDLAIQYAPYNYESYAKKGEMLYTLHSYNEAIENYTKLLEIENIPYYLLCRSLAYYQVGNQENAIKDAKQAEKLFKKKDNKRYKLAEKLQNSKFLNENDIKELESEIFNFDEDGKLPTLIISNEFRYDDNIKDAKKYYNMLFDKDVNDKEIIKYQKGYNHLIKGNYEKAKEIFNCKEVDVLVDTDNIGQELCQYYSDKIKSAKIFSEITKKTVRASSWKIFGQIKLENYDKKGAINAFNKVIELNPYDFEVYYDRALIKKDNGDYEGAIKDIELATQYDPYNAELYFNASRFLMDIHIEQLEKNISNLKLINEISENIDKAIRIINQNKYLITRAMYNISLYDSVDEKKLEQSRNDISIVIQRAKKYNKKKDLAIATKILEDITKLENNYAYSLIPMSIYRQAYYSIDKIKEFCNDEEIDNYIKLAEETYSILNYKELEENLHPETVKYIRTVASDIFDKDYGALNNKDFVCAFIKISPYDMVVDTGIKLLEMIDKHANKTQFYDNYKKFKNTIISYIPKMRANSERKEELTKYVKQFE